MQEELKEFQQASDLNTLWASEVSALRLHGAIRLLAVRPAGGDEGDNDDIRSADYPASFIARYVGDKLWRHDPARREAASRLKPFCRSEIGDLQSLTAEEKRFCDYYRSCAIGDGHIIPVYGPRGANGFVEVITSAPCLDEDAVKLHSMQTIAQMAHQRYCELQGIDPDRLPQLSEREREILLWVAQGKSNRSIAEILAISANTVDTYLRRIYEKLGVTDRTRAAIRGIAYGLIQP